jgi:hypothetical protein
MMQKIEYEGWPNCIRLFNNELELIITTVVGPRIIRCGFINGENLLYVSEEDKGKTGGSQWRIYGGHRLWHAPEVMPRTYFPDNHEVGFTWNGKMLKLIQPLESTTGIIKEMEITLDPVSNHVEILHRLINKNLWTVETSLWAITAHAPGGKAILPQEPYIDPADYLLPARPIVLWHYTNMNDPRWIWGNKYIQLKHESTHKTEQKTGILNKQGWAAYIRNNDLMIKRFDYNPDAQYADYGCNNEFYVNGDLLEIETLGPVQQIAPDDCAEHVEHWLITRYKGEKMDESEESIDRLLVPVINSFYRVND